MVFVDFPTSWRLTTEDARLIIDPRSVKAADEVRPAFSFKNDVV